MASAATFDHIRAPTMSPKSDDSFDNFDTAESQNLLSDPSSDFQPNPSSVHKQCTCGNASFMKWTAIFIGVCTLANLVLGFIPVKSIACHDELASISRTQLSQLHRPSPYIGLSQIDRTNSTPPAPILNFPHVIAQVDKSRPTKVFDDDPLRYMSISGTVSPQKHEVRVKDSVISTVFQFRAIDYGMENCELVIQFPGEDSTSQTFDIHKLDSAWYLDTKELSYQTRPRRISKLDTISLSKNGLHWSYNYTCAWDELMTFELACRDGPPGALHIPCDISWWQDEEDEDSSPGIIIRQHNSV